MAKAKELLNIVRNAARPSYFPEMVRKIYFAARYGTREENAGLAWARVHAESMDAWAGSLDSICGTSPLPSGIECGSKASLVSTS